MPLNSPIFEAPKMAIIMLLLLVPYALGAEYSSNYCGSNKTTYTLNSTYYLNLLELLSLISPDHALTIDLFSNQTVGKSPPDVAYGLYLCRADKLANDCRNCLITASKEIAKACPNQKHAIRWSNDCMLRYSNDFFFSKMEVDPFRYECNKRNVSSLEGERKRFEKVVVGMMEELVIEASNHSKKYAYKEAMFNSTQKVFGLVQCTEDLSGSDCDRCLRTHMNRAVNEFCGGKIGGRLLTPSCNLRYEFYEFYKFHTSDDEPRAPSPPESSKNRAILVPFLFCISWIPFSPQWHFWGVNMEVDPHILIIESTLKQTFLILCRKKKDIIFKNGCYFYSNMLLLGAFGDMFFINNKEGKEEACYQKGINAGSR
ncbi:hypothetical protein OSB04_008439 [Centaurea solstitialis]|uniref:Gnk2-homologous domain-containing protein n=1 Tax=Centaurea solstitialis TaxID=347529 RepID=A0AA38TLU5_9ASTR|nr:hypothetical protein OSB04_008439 [Centaurea solstitialis]